MSGIVSGKRTRTQNQESGHEFMIPIQKTASVAPQGFLARIGTAVQALKTGRPLVDNPLSHDPEDRSRGELVTELQKWCLAEREFWKPVFDRMREEQRFAAGKQWVGGYMPRTGMKEAYVGDVIQQMINRQTASLYAKNPEPEAEIVERMNFELWDGNQDTIDAAQAVMQQAAPIMAQAQQINAQRQQMMAQGTDPTTVPPEPPAPPQAVTMAGDVLRDYHTGMAEKAILRKVADTATLLIKNQWNNQNPPLLVSGKKAVTRVLVSRVAYMKVLYRRDMESVITQSASDMELSDRIATLQGQLRTCEQDATEADDARNEEARLMKISLEKQIEELQAEQPPPVIGDEGIIIDWLGSTAVLVDRGCTDLHEFVGARRIAHEMFMSVQDCEAKYKIDLRDSGAKFYDNAEGSYQRSESEMHESTEKEVQAKNYKVCVWEIQDKRTGLVYTVVDGVKDFIKEPATNSPELSRFWNIIPIVFNCQEVEENLPEQDVTIFPRSQVRLAMPMQQDMNTAGEGLREHRVANRPTMVAVKAAFASVGGQNDCEKLRAPRAAFDLILLENLMEKQKISDLIQLLPVAPIDEKMYDVSASSQAMMLATGEQPSDIGAQRPDEKATGQNIAAQARATSIGSCIDDLDMVYSMLAQMCGEMLLKEMSGDQVKELVGRGATWPDVAREDFARDIFFAIKAGSTGRPNEQADLNNFKVIAPQLGQLMTQAGKSLEPLIKEGVRRLGDKLNVDDFLKPAQVVPPPKPEPEPSKPPTISITMPFQALPPEIQTQVEQAAGFKPASPASHLINKVGHAESIKAHTQNLETANQVQPQTMQNNS